MNLKSIERQIIESADKELDEQIKKETDYIHNRIDWHKKVTIESVQCGINRQFTATPGDCLMLLRQHLKDQLKPKLRQSRLNEFLSKVDRLIDTMAELGIQREQETEHNEL